MMRARSGFTLVEQVLALSLLAVGLVAMAGAGDALHRAGRRALRQAATAAAAGAWRDRLLAGACVLSAAGGDSAAAMHVAWTVADGGALRRIVVEATAADAGTPGSLPVRHRAHGTTWCAAP